MALEFVKELLNEKLGCIVWLGKTRTKCQAIVLEFHNGGVHWYMQKSELCPIPEDGQFFNDFFAFQDFIDQINVIYIRFIAFHESAYKCMRIAVTISEYLDFYDFLSTINVIRLPSVIDFTSKSLILYFKQQLSVDLDIQSKRESIVMGFLRDAHLIVKGETIQSLNLNDLGYRLQQLIYHNTYTPKLRQHYQPNQDVLGIYEAISFGKRVNVPYCMVYKFLLEMEKEKDPEYKAQMMRDSRLKAFDK